MQHMVGHQLEFNCQNCSAPIHFSVLNTKALQEVICCQECNKKYLFDDETLVRQLQLFEALCRQVQRSEEILGNTSIAVNVGEHQIKVPFNILLTRLSSCLDLNINGKKSTITFRLDPLKDVK
jgi:hypothetical protein